MKKPQIPNFERPEIFRLPRKNPFIPTNFDILSDETLKANSEPIKLNSLKNNVEVFWM